MQMKKDTNFPEQLCTDEAVCFIAERHNLTPRQLLEDFTARETGNETALRGGEHITLEPNEIEILRALLCTVTD